MYTPAAIDDIRKVSQYMVANDQQKRGLLSGGTDPRWARMLYVEGGSLNWMLSMDPSHASIEKTAYYVYALCGKWALLAQAAMRAAGVVPGGGTTSDGSVINPETGSAVAFDFEYLIPIKGTDFQTATTYSDTRIVGHSLQVFWNEVNRFLEWGTEVGYTDTGIEILIPEFDAQTTHADATFKIYIKDPDVYSDAPSGGGATESGGTAVAFDSDAPYLIPAGTILESVVILPGSAAEVAIGTTGAGEELLPFTPVTTEGYMVVLNLFSLAGRTIYFTGLPAGSTIVFFTKSVNLT